MNSNRWLHIGAVLAGMAVVAASLGGCVLGVQDTATANTLDVRMTLKVPETFVSTGPQDVARVTVSFFTDQGAYPTNVYAYELTHGETFVCNGAFFSLDGSKEYTFVGSIPLAQMQGTLACAYTRDGTTTRVSLLTPPRPTILAPAAQANLPATQDLEVRYTAAPPASTDISINGSPVVTVAPDLDSAIIPLAVMSQLRRSQEYLLTVSQTTTLTPVSSFNSLTITYTASSTESFEYA